MNTNNMYKSDISDARWIAYDLPGNVGWILYFVGLTLCFTKGPTVKGLLVAAVPAMLMLIGIVELINERIHKLDRILPKVRLYRGFGALTLGGIAGTLIAAILLIFAAGSYLWMMLIGGILCAIFAGLLFVRYKKM